MFDVSFSELMVIAVVALLVIGPEKLPKVARTFGAFAGRMQRYMAQVKEEVNREIRFEELQKLQQEIKQSVESAVEIDVERKADATGLNDVKQANTHGPSRPAKSKSSIKKNQMDDALKPVPATKTRASASVKPVKARAAKISNDTN